MRTAIQVRRVRASQGRFDDPARHFQEKRIDLGGLDGCRGRVLRRDHLEHGLQSGAAGAFTKTSTAASASLIS